MNIRIIRSVWFLDENRVIHYGKQGGVVDAVLDPNRFDLLCFSTHALLAEISGSSCSIKYKPSWLRERRLHPLTVVRELQCDRVYCQETR